MTDGTPSPAPLAAQALQPGTDAAAARRPAPSSADATVPSDRGGRPFWARLDSPFTAGLLLTLGGLVALLLGIALTNIATVIIYIALAMFAALGLDPVLKWFERHNVKRRWAIAIVFLILGCHRRRPAVARRADPRSSRSAQFITGIPATIANFEKTDTYAWLEGIFGTGLEHLVTSARSSSPIPRTSPRSRAACSRSAPASPPRSRARLIIVVLTLYFVASLPAHQGVDDAVRAGPQPAARCVNMTDQITDSVGGYLMGMVILAFFNSVVAILLHLVLRLALPAADGRARVLDHDHPARRSRAVLDLRHHARPVHEPDLGADLRHLLPDLHPDRGVRDHAARS